MPRRKKNKISKIRKDSIDSEKSDVDDEEDDDEIENEKDSNQDLLTAVDSETKEVLSVNMNQFFTIILFNFIF